MSDELKTYYVEKIHEDRYDLFQRETHCISGEHRVIKKERITRAICKTQNECVDLYTKNFERPYTILKFMADESKK